MDFTPAFILAYYQRWINRDLNYEPMRSKALTLEPPALRYIHKLLVYMISGQESNTVVVSTRDLFFLYNMRERESHTCRACFSLVLKVEDGSDLSKTIYH